MSTNAGDTYVYQKSLQTQREKTPFSKREIIHALDVSSGSYGSASQIQWDLSQFANVTSGMLDFSNATMQIPICITATSPDNANANTAPGNLDGFLAMKNGSWNCINSLSVNIDGHELIQPNSLYNTYVSYKMLTSMSQDDLRNMGSSHLFAGPDETKSWVYNNKEADTITNAGHGSRLVNGNGLCNNAPFIKTSRLPASSKTSNNGYWELGNSKFFERMTMINDRPDDVFNKATVAATPVNVTQNLGDIRDEQCYINELKNYTKSNNGTTGDTFIQQWFVLCNIKLAFLSDLFQNLPLVRGLYAKINVTLNTGSFIVNLPVHADNATCALHVRPNEIFFNNFNPIQVCERATALTGTAPNIFERPVAYEGGRYLISVGVVGAFNTSVSGFQSHGSKNGRGQHALTTCRITIPVNHVKPDDLIPYLESTKEYRVEYTDVYQTRIDNVEPGKRFDVLLSNGSKDIIGLLIIPTISSKSNGLVDALTPANIPEQIRFGGASASGFSTNLSPFVGEAVAPLSLTGLSVIYGGDNVFTKSVDYGWEQFIYNFQDFNRINGNQSLGLGSGLISEQQWSDYYRYYFVNLSRKLEEDTQPKSLNVQATNNSKVTADYIVFVISKKSFMLNTSTGRVTK